MLYAASLDRHEAISGMSVSLVFLYSHYMGRHMTVSPQQPVTPQSLLERG